MGNYCKSIGDGKVNGCNPSERIHYKTFDAKWLNTFQLKHKAGKESTVKNVTTPVFGKDKIIANNLHATKPVFIAECARNRPPGVSNED